jgi:hypothetical protein
MMQKYNISKSFQKYMSLIMILLRFQTHKVLQLTDKNKVSYL